MKPYLLTDDIIQEIFGADGAEWERDERFLQYFYSNKAYESLTSNMSVRILVGHKGVGKSALLKRAALLDNELKIKSIKLQPGAIIDDPSDYKDVSLIKFISVWKKGILKEILRSLFGAQNFSQIPELEKSGVDDIAAMIARWLRENSSSSEREIINVYIDDVDRGWKATASDITSISALLNAIRDIGGAYPQIRFRIGLRSDVYFLVRTSDESTDKIESNVIWLRWSNDEILRVMAKRIATFFEMDIDQNRIASMEQSQITSHILSQIIEPRFGGKGRWENRPVHTILLSLTRARPRDLVKLFTLAAKKAHSRDRNKIISLDLNDVFESYSIERLQDIENEFKSELPTIQNLLFAMKPTKIERTTAESYTFSMDKLSTKVSNIIRQNSFRFTNGKSVSARSIIQFLYKIDFITARKTLENGTIDRRYFDESRFLAHDFVDFGYAWEIHPAYRWALQPFDVQKMLDKLDM